MAADNSSTTSPEYMTFRKCYPTIIHYVKEQPGTFCDALFANNYIPITVRDYTRNKYVSDEEKAQKQADTLIDRIEQDPSVFHDFIKIIEEAGPWADEFARKLKDGYKTERKVLEWVLDSTRYAGASENNEEHISGDDIDTPHSTTELEQILETKFPYLDVPSLSECEKTDLEVHLRSDIRSMKIKFSDFRVAIRDSLEHRVPLDKIKDSILSLDAFTDGIGVKVLDPQDAQKIESAESLSRVFITLSEYISFFNYEIIEHLIHQYGTVEDEKKLQEYCLAFKTFCKRNVYEVPPSAYSKPRSEAKEFVLKCSQHTLALHDVQVIKDKVAKVLGLNYSTLQLSTIEKGCVELHFFIPAAVADRIFPVSPSQNSALDEIGVRVLIPAE